MLVTLSQTPASRRTDVKESKVELSAVQTGDEVVLCRRTRTGDTEYSLETVVRATATFLFCGNDRTFRKSDGEAKEWPGNLHIVPATPENLALVEQSSKDKAAQEERRQEAERQAREALLRAACEWVVRQTDVETVLAAVGDGPAYRAMMDLAEALDLDSEPADDEESDAADDQP